MHVHPKACVEDLAVSVQLCWNFASAKVRCLPRSTPALRMLTEGLNTCVALFEAYPVEHRLGRQFQKIGKSAVKLKDKAIRQEQKNQGIAAKQLKFMLREVRCAREKTRRFCHKSKRVQTISSDSDVLLYFFR